MTVAEPRVVEVDADTFGLDEWFVVALARTIRDRETVFHGFGSPCAQVAMHLARRTHAPDMLLVEGATYAVNPEPLFIPPTGNDLSLQAGSFFQMRFEEFFDAAARGDVDRMFLSGGQIDAYGNTNVTAIGSLANPKVKLGGGGGGCNLSATIRTLTLWTTRHRGGRTLVDRCDFITDMGHSAATGRRSGGTGGGPQWLITELGLFDFDADGHARLCATFPDIDPDAVAAATGFKLRTLDTVGVIPAPTPDQVALIRRIDPLGVRRAEFAPAELQRRFGYPGQTL
ncbi:MAG TPA: CoA-transferase [Sporichthyaceae bacterium]|jgi:glutaconate CoA-transferase subunit B|nr:CoA-transferase [Sporichthyaceae bacterium]